MNQSLEVTVPLRESIDDPEGGLVGTVYPTLKLMARDSQLTLTQHARSPTPQTASCSPCLLAKGGRHVNVILLMMANTEQ